MRSFSKLWTHTNQFWDTLLNKPTAAIPLHTTFSRIQVESLEDRTVLDGRPLPYPYIFAGSGPGAPAQVIAYYADSGTIAFQQSVFESTFTGGARVATGDITGDKYPDLIVAAGAGGGPRVRIFDGKTGKTIPGPLGDFFTYTSTFTGGVFVAAGDVNGDGRADVITAAGAGGGSHIKVFDGLTGKLIRNFFAFDPTFLGGATIAAADFTGDGKVDLAVGAGPGGGPQVKIFDLQTEATIPSPIGNFFAFDPSFRGGVDVGADWKAGDITGDDHADLVVGAGPGGGPHVKVYDGKTGAEVDSFFAFDPTMTAGVRVGAAYVNDDLFADVVVGTGQGPTAQIHVFDGQTTTLLPQPMGTYTPFGNNFTGGLFIAASNDPAVPILPQQPIGEIPLYSPVMPGIEDSWDLDPISTPLESQRSGVAGHDYGVRTDGALDVQLVNLPGMSATSGSVQNFTIDWSNATSNLDLSAGSGTSQINLSHLVKIGPAGESGIAIVNGPLSARFFNATAGGDYQAAFGSKVLFEGGRIPYTFKVTDGEGSVIEYYNFSIDTATALQGKWKKRTDKNGNTDEVTSRTVDGQPLTIDSHQVSGVTERLAYTYSNGLIDTVTRIKAGQTAGSVTLHYATVDSQPVLKGSTEYNANGIPVGDTYNRYYSYGDVNGYSQGLKYHLGQAATAQLKGAYPNINLDSLTDEQVAPFADKAFHYAGGTNAVSQVTKAGLGNSMTSGGQGTVDVLVSQSPNATSDVNDWFYKLQNSYPDGSVHTIYANQYNQTLLQVVQDVDGKQWRAYSRYDATGALLFQASPSAVTGYDESLSDLIGYSPTGSTYLSSNSGLITNYIGGSTTSATDSAEGDVEGFLKTQSIQQGTSGVPVLQLSSTYIAHTTIDTRTLAALTTYHLASSTQFRNTNGSGGETTHWSYQWIPQTHQASQITTTRPDSSTTASVFDNEGRIAWTRAGALNYYAYDPITGVLVKTIKDVNTSLTSDFTNLPAYWTTLSGQGLHQVTSVEVDAMGRTIKTTDPMGIVNYAVYDDVNHAKRIYPAWNAATNTPTGPITVLRDDQTHGYIEQLTMTATPTVDGGRPTGQEAISNIQTLSRAYRNAVGQVVDVDNYFNLSGLTYTTDPTLGTSGIHFNRVHQDYDYLGNPNRTVSSMGTITRTVYDSLGRVSSQWIGTNDTPIAVVWSPNNPADMVEISEQVYDQGGSGDGNLTSVILKPGDGTPDRVTQFAYDWRDRPVAVKSGVEAVESTSVNRPLIVTQYDNLNEPILTQTYDGDGISFASFSPEFGGLPDQSLLRSQVAQSFDDMGRVVSTSLYGVNATTGVATTTPLTSHTWYDANGNTIESLAPNGLATKVTYDGLNRPTKIYETDNGINSNNSSPSTVYADHVYRQSEIQYDANSNPIMTTVRVRMDGQTGTGALGTPTTGVLARVSYSADYYDSANRFVANVDVGTNGGNVWTRPNGIPATSDTTHVSTTAYDAAGRPWSWTAADGTILQSLHDAAGRTTATVVAAGTPIAMTTTATYNADNQVISVTAPGNRTTTFGYDSWGRAVSVTERANTPLARTTTTNSNRIGETLSTTDPMGMVTSLQHNVLGQVIGATVGAGTSLAQSGSVQYDTLGRLIGQTNSRGYTSHKTYDDVNSTTSVTNALNQTATQHYDNAGNLVSTTDALGNTNTATYDLLGQMTSSTDPLGNTSTIHYNVGGNQQHFTDPLNRTWTTTLDAFGRISSQTDPLGHATTYGYDRVGQLTTSTDPLGTVNKTVYDVLGRVTSTTQAVGTSLQRTTSAEYNTSGDLVRVVDPRGVATAYVYDSAGRMTSTTAAQGLPDAMTMSQTYDLNDNITSTTQPGNHTTGYNYDLLGQLTTVTEGMGTSLARTTKHAYDVGGNLTSTTDALNRVTSTSYDALDRPVTMTDPLGHVTSVNYDAVGQMISLTDPLSNITNWNYDAAGQQTKQTDAVGTSLQRSQSWQYNAAGELTQTVDPRGIATAYAYDAAGRMTSTTAAAGLPEAFTVSQTYDANNQVISVTAPGNRTTAYTYDSLGQNTSVTSGVGTALAQTTNFAYDAGGNSTSTTDALNRTTSTSYDHLNRPVATTDALGKVTTMAYNSAGDLASLTDPLGNVTSWTYDALGQQTKQTDPLGHSSTSSYDAVGQLVNITDRLGQQKTFSYDANGQLVHENWLNASNSLVDSQSFSYDANGNLLTASNNAGSYSMAYDQLNRVTSVSEPNNTSLAFGYDADSNRTSVTDNFGGTTTSTYDGLNRLTRRQMSGTNITPVRVDYGYNSTGDLTTTTQSAQVIGSWTVAATTSKAYDTLDRLTSMTTTNAGGSTLSSYAMTYDAGNRLTSETINGSTQSYGYDANDQITSANGVAISYDANGNRISGGSTVSAGNRLQSDGTWAYTYNDNGQVTSKASGATTWTYNYDLNGQMTSASDGTNSVAYTYDVFGNRIQRTSGGTTERYAYDGWDTAKPGAVGTENFDVWGDLSSTNNLTTRRMYGAGIDQPLVKQDSSGNATWYGLDNHGSVTQVFDNSGNVTGSRQYSAFGAITTQSGTGLDRYAYTAREWDSTIQLQYNRARMYDPTTGRWMSEDPMGFAAGDANLSRYVGNNATGSSDPSGYLGNDPYFAPGPTGGYIDPGYFNSPRGGSDDIDPGWGVTPPGGWEDIDPGYTHGARTRGNVPPAPPELSGSNNGLQNYGDNNTTTNQGGYLSPLNKNASWDISKSIFGDAFRLVGTVANTVVGRVSDTVSGPAPSLNLPQSQGELILRNEQASIDPHATPPLGNLQPILGPGSGAVGTLKDILNYYTEPLPGSPETLGGQLMPVVGNARETRAAINAERYDRAILYGGLTALDLLGVGELFTFAKAAIKGLVTVSARSVAEHMVTNRGVIKLLESPCFTAGTPLRTQFGSRSIEEIAVGDMVLSRDEHCPDGIVSAKTVEEVFVRNGLVWELRLGGQTIRTTAEHPFYRDHDGWVAANVLQVGDKLLCEDGTCVTVEDVRDTGEWQTVYNLRIADYHTYFVGSEEWGFSVWAHNACVRVVVDSDTGKAYVYFNRVEKPVEFNSLTDAESWMQKVGHTHYTVPTTPPKAFPGTQTVDISKIKPAPSVQREFADPDKLLNHGFFDWDTYQPLQVYVKDGVYYFQNGMTRMENARRFGITQLPVQIVSAP